MQVEYDYDFYLLGIVCHEKDYRLCWMLNNLFDIRLAKTDDLTTEHGKHSLFSLISEEQFREYHLVANRGSEGMLIDEHRQIDYFFLVKGAVEEDERKQMIEQVKKSGMVGAAYAIDASLLKSKHNLIF